MNSSVDSPSFRRIRIAILSTLALSCFIDPPWFPAESIRSEAVASVGSGRGDGISPELCEVTCLLLDDRVCTFVGATFPPPYSRSLGFKATCCVLGLSTFLYLCLAKIRLDKVRARKESDSAAKERGDRAYEISDRLLQGVQAIAWSIETARVHAEGNEPVKKILADSSKQSDVLLEEGRRRIMSVQGQSDEEDLPNALAAACQELQNDWPSRCRVIVNGETRSLQPMLRDDVYRIGREALSNSFHHADATEIEAEFFYTRFEMRVYFRDDGRGISSGVLARRQHNVPRGMSEMCRMARAAGVDLEIRSRRNLGTEIELRVPASLAYDVDESGDRFGGPTQFLWRKG